MPGLGTHDDRIELMASQVRALFGTVPETLEDFAFASQSTQAEALKFFIEWFRAGKWRRTGIIWWNLLDGWPQFSDAIVDYYLVRKRAFEVVKRAQAPVCLILSEPAGGRQDVVVSNDTHHDLEVAFTIRDERTGAVVLDGSCLARADSVSPAGTIPVPTNQTLYGLTWHSDLGPARSHYLLGDPPFSLADYKRWTSRVGL